MNSLDSNYLQEITIPWCPKCNSEYRDEFTTCADCGSELIDQNPNLPSTSAPASNIYDILKLAIIAMSAPWICYFLAAGLANITMFLTPGIATGLALIVSPLLVFSLAFVYCWYRQSIMKASLLVGSLAISAVLNIVLSFFLVLVNIIEEPYKLIFCLPLYIMFSGAFLVVVWIGSYLHRLQSRMDS